MEEVKYKVLLVEEQELFYHLILERRDESGPNVIICDINKEDISSKEEAIRKGFKDTYSVDI